MKDSDVALIVSFTAALCRSIDANGPGALVNAEYVALYADMWLMQRGVSLDDVQPCKGLPN